MRVLSRRSLVCGAGVLPFASTPTRATRDTEILKITQLGIPGTTIPPSSFPGAQADPIIAFLRRGLEVTDL